MTRVRAAVVVTGTELVRGDRADLNGPFLARELNARGLEAARVTIVGDRPDELEAALEEGLRADLLVVSGGLGPTHDDRTVGLLARAAGRNLVVDSELEGEIERVSRRIAERLGRPYGEFAPGVTKQASLPEGAASLGLAGTAPGIVLDTGSCVVVTLPGPPAELRRLWANAVESEPVRRVLAGAEPPERRTLRYYGVSESAVARVLAEAGGEQGGVEATVCARDFEIHVDLVGDADELASLLRRELAEYLFSEDERPVAEIVLDECRARTLTLATAESCTGGLVAEMLTAIPGSSDVFLGGIVAYANEVKVAQLGVPAECAGKARRGVRGGRAGDGRGRAPAPRRRRRRGRHGGRRPRRGDAGEARGHRLLPCADAGRRPGDALRLAGRAWRRAQARGRRCAASGSADSWHRAVALPPVASAEMSARASSSVSASPRTPSIASRDGSGRPSGTYATSGSSRAPTSTSRWRSSATVRPASWTGSSGTLRESASGAAIPNLTLRRYRETRSVGMLVFDDEAGRATALAVDLHDRLEALGVYEREQRPWLPHATVIRFRRPPRLHPPLPDLGEVSPSEAAVYHSLLRRGGAQYVALETVRLGGG